jgi:polysaccharide biosynthesis transport protein
MPTVPISPNIEMNVLVAAVIGLVLAVGGIFVIEYLDDTIKTADDIKRLVDLPTIGTIPRIHGTDYPSKLIALHFPLSPIAEAFRVLRLKIQFYAVGAPIRTLVFISPNPKEGKSVCLANLAVSMAQSGMRVILVDADLRRPVQHLIFGLSDDFGLTDILLDPSLSKIITGQAQMRVQDQRYASMKVEGGSGSPAQAKTASDAGAVNPVDFELNGPREYILGKLQETGIENLRVLTSGPLQPNPTELLELSQVERIIEILKSDADIVMFDSPAFLLVSDAVLLATLSDKVIMVNDAGVTRVSDARRTVEDLRRVGADLLGVVLNRQTNGNGRYQYYKYYHENGSSKMHRDWKFIKSKTRKLSHEEVDEIPD